MKFNAKFNYPSSVRALYNGMRLYDVNNEKLPSVTTILNETQDGLQFINNNENKIKKYFKCGNWSYFRSNSNIDKRELGTLIKNIYKSQKFTIHSKSVNITVNNKSIGTKQLFFYKDGDVIHFSD